MAVKVFQVVLTGNTAHRLQQIANTIEADIIA